MDDSAGEDTDQIRHGSGRRILPDLSGLDLLGSGVLVLDAEGRVAFANLAACQLLAMTPRRMRGCTPAELVPDLKALDAPLDQLRSQTWGQQGVDITLMRPGQAPLALHCLAVVLEDTGGMLLVELHEIERRRRIDRETRLHESARASRAMLRQLAHEDGLHDALRADAFGQLVQRAFVHAGARLVLAGADFFQRQEHGHASGIGGGGFGNEQGVQATAQSFGFFGCHDELEKA